MRAIVFANGSLERLPAELRITPAEDLIVAADGGLANCLRHGLRPHLLVGDLDSVEPAQIASLEGLGVEIEPHPTSKDQTDLELALRACLHRGADHLLILGALGGRGDMTLGNALLLAAPFLKAVDVRILDGAQQILCLHGGYTLTLRGEPGALLSLIPLGAPAVGVALSGVEYPLREATLELGSTRGLSNRLSASRAEIVLRRGALCVIMDTKIATIQRSAAPTGATP